MNLFFFLLYKKLWNILPVIISWNFLPRIKGFIQNNVELCRKALTESLQLTPTLVHVIREVTVNAIFNI